MFKVTNAFHSITRQHLHNLPEPPLAAPCHLPYTLIPIIMEWGGLGSSDSDYSA